MAGGLIQNEDFRIAGESTGKGDQLPLTAGEGTTPLHHRFVEAQFLPLDDFGSIDLLEGFADPLS